MKQSKQQQGRSSPKGRLVWRYGEPRKSAAAVGQGAGGEGAAELCPAECLTASLGKGFQQGAAWADWCHHKALPAVAWEEDGGRQPPALQGARPGARLKRTSLGKTRGLICSWSGRWEGAPLMTWVPKGSGAREGQPLAR